MLVRGWSTWYGHVPLGIFGGSVTNRRSGREPEYGIEHNRLFAAFVEVEREACLTAHAESVYERTQYAPAPTTGTMLN
ncbi:MAG: hypothetical protein OXM02_11170 [Bacteroidota bacterium]|nr:hypothetical protein [Bacteroidota bacterium]